MGRKGRKRNLFCAFKSEILLAGVAKNDHKEGGDYFGHGGVPS